MSRPSSSLIQDQEAIYDSIGPQGLPTASHYSSPGHTSAPPYSFPLHSNPPYNPQPSPVRKFSPSNNAVSSSTPQYMSPPSQYIPVHHNSMASPPPNYMSSASQYISAPCTVTASPISQADVSHEIFRPTPRRPTDSSMSNRLSSVSPTRVPPHNNSLAHVVSVGGTNPPITRYSPYSNNSEGTSPKVSNIGQTSIPPLGRKSNSPPTRSTPVSRGQNANSSATSRLTPQIDGSSRNASPTYPEQNRPPKEELQQGMQSSPTQPQKVRKHSDRLGSPFWCGVGSRDPQSRQFEFPERDVPTTSGSGVNAQSNITMNAVAVHDNLQPVSQNSAYKHVTNLLIDKENDKMSNTSYNLHLPVPAYESQKSNNNNFPVSSDNEDEDSGGEEHPAVKQGRSSFIKYNSSNKLKPKRKFINHVDKGNREKFRHHEHVKQGGDSDGEKEASKPLHTRPISKKGKFSKSLEKANQLLEVKAALEQLSIDNNNTSIHSSVSTYSSMSDCDSEQGSQQLEDKCRKERETSHETLSTTVTSADEFVWIDSHNRLVEVQQLPWTNEDLLKVLKNGAMRESSTNISLEVIPRLSYYMQRVLVRVAREAQRLSQKVHKCSKHEVMSALRLILSPQIASSSIKACLRAGAMYNISSDHTRQTKSSRAGLFLDIGKVQQWMCTVKVGKFIQEYAAVYLTAGLENILEEVLTHCLLTASEVTTSVLEHSISTSPELWGIFQPYAHLSSCRTSKGSLTVPKCINLAPSDTVRLASTGKNIEKSMTQILLTTCVGSKEELEALVAAATQFYKKNYQPITSQQTPAWNKDSLHTLYYFMRCSQLENHGCELNSPIQELVYERPYMVLPPLIEWLRVTLIFCESRFCMTIDQDDVYQAARILLPGADFPPRGQGFSEQFSSTPDAVTDELEYVDSLNQTTAFQMLISGRKDLIPHALQMLPATKVNTPNQQGLTPLMVACLREDVTVVRILLETGASLDYRNPGTGKNTKHANPEQQHWTALHYATMTGNYDVVRLLLEKGSNVEGAIDLDDDICTETPLQLASAAGKVEIVELLLSFGSSPFLSTLKVDSMSFGSSAQKGCYAALSTAASHGQRKTLHKLVTHPTTLTSQQSGKEVLSLEEILAEGVAGGVHDKDEKHGNDMRRPSKGKLYSRFSKSNVKKLQEAMYQSTENENIDITLDLRNFGVPWTLHCWIRTLLTAQHNGFGSVIDELLQDFSKEWTEDNSSYFTDECLPVLFSIFRTNKSEGTTLFLADVLSACYGKDQIDKIVFFENVEDLKCGPRIDPKFVNNPELSDIQFRVEGRLFYAHKLVLITSSFKFRSMLNSKFCEGSPPILQINDIRYEIFETVMHYLYKGTTEELNVEASDILELMAAANFFQLDGLLHYCEVRCASLINLDTIVSYYIHAKVYSAKNLLTYCEGFLLQNLVALLTYDDSVKRLIFGKKLQNHDVITGLLKTLQERVKKKGPSKSKKHSL